MYHYQNVCGTRRTIKAHKTYAHTHTRARACLALKWGQSLGLSGRRKSNAHKENWQKIDIAMAYSHIHIEATKCFYTFWGFICLRIVHSWFIFSDQYNLGDGATFVCTVNGYVPLDEVRCRCVMCRTHIHLIFALFIFSTHARPLLNASQSQPECVFDSDAEWMWVCVCVIRCGKKKNHT